MATRVFGLPADRLTMEDTQAALDLPFGEACEFLADKYPKGFWISNGHRYVQSKGGDVEAVEVAVDAMAIKMFSASNINAEDAVGLAFWQVLHDKANLRLAVKVCLCITRNQATPLAPFGCVCTLRARLVGHTLHRGVWPQTIQGTMPEARFV